MKTKSPNKCSKSHRRELSILKSQEEFQNRLRTLSWDNPKSDSQFRLNALLHFAPARTDRQIFNLAEVNIK